MKIHHKVTVAFMIVAFLVALVGYVGLRGITTISDSFRELKDDAVDDTIRLNQIRIHVAEMLEAVSDFRLTYG